MATVAGGLTYEDLELMPDDGRRYELINGEIVVSPSPNRPHQELIWRLALLINLFVRPRRLGEVILAPFDVKLLDLGAWVQPDIIFFGAERLHLLRNNEAVGAPDLVVEVLSPSTRGRDQGEKLALYAAAGVREYWLADPVARTLRLLLLDADRYRRLPETDGVVSSAVLAGLDVEVAPLFADLP